MNKILLDFFMPITAINPTAQPSTAFLKQLCFVVLPKMGVTAGVITEVTTETEIAAITDNTDAFYALRAGMSKVYMLPMDDLNLATALNGPGSNFYTILISSDFDKDDVTATQAAGSTTITSYANLVSGTADTIEVAGQLFTAQAGAATLGTAFFQAATSNNATATSLAAQINAHDATKDKVTAVAVGAVVTITAQSSGTGGNAYTLAYDDNDANVGATVTGSGTLSGGDGLDLGAWKGVSAVVSNDKAWLKTQNTIENRVGVYATTDTKGKNMAHAFGNLLKNANNWLNQQFIEMPFADDVDQLGEAVSLFDDRITFILEDAEYAKRLGFFGAGGKAIVAPYIKRNLEIDMQGVGLAYVSANQPQYTLTEAALIENEMQKVIDGTPTKPGYVQKKWLTGGKVEIKLEGSNFVASGYILIPPPTALWRIPTEIRETT